MHYRYSRHAGALASGLAMVAAPPVLAQTAAEAAPDASEPGAAPQDSGNDQGARVQDIIVTAQRRAQSLQDVPISVNAFDSQAIEALGAESMGDLDNFTPGLDVSDASVTQPRYSIRGVKTSDFGIGTEPSVGIFVDGVYAARSGASLVFFNDVKRVEVLKGPQGTLFGRNTSAGAISIVTNKPVDRKEAFGTLRIANYGKVRFNVTGNTPITDNLYVRINAVVNREDGYLHDAITGEDRERENNTSTRFALRWEPSPDTTIDFAYDHDDTDQDGPTAVGISQFALSQDPHGPFANDVIDNHETRILNGVTLTGRHDFGAVELTSITAYKYFHTTNREDEDGTADATRYLDTENREHNKSFYQELRLSHDDARFHVLGGVSYFHEKGDQTSAVTALTDSVNTLVGGLFSPIAAQGVPIFGIPFEEDMDNFIENDSYAAYADATYDLTSKFSVTAGIRYTRDEKQFTWFNGPFMSPGIDAISAPGGLYNAIIGAPAFPAGAQISVGDFFRAVVGPNGLIYDEGPLEGQPFTRDESFEDVSPRFVVEYHINPDALIYASASRGYKAGGFDGQSINSFFAPENVWNYEGGVKSEYFDHRLRLNASAYYFKYKNRQSISLEQTDPRCNQDPIPAGLICVPRYVTRSGDSRAYGVDASAQILVGKDLTLSATAGAIDSEWVTRIERGIDISGQPTGDPRFRGTLSGHYNHAFQAGTLSADISYSYTAPPRRNDADRDRDADIADYVDFDQLDEIYSSRSVINARIGWRFPGDHLSLSAFARNLLDSRRPRSINTITADIFNTPYVRIDEPRYFGGEIGYRF